MSEWRECRLGDILKVKHGFAFKGEFITENPTGNILVTPGNFHIGGGFKSDKFKYYSSEDFPNEYILSANDIVVTMTDLSKESDTLGYSAKIPVPNKKKYLHNQRVGLLQFFNSDFDSDYIYWLLRTRDYQGYVVGSASGTSIMHTSPSRIEDYVCLFPPLPEQKAIASVLSSLDDKIDLLHRQNKTLEAMAETLFRQWFVENTDITTVKLGDIIEIFDSKRIPLSSTERDKMKSGILYPYYGAATIMDYINDYIFDDEYLLFGEDGTVQTEEGFPVLQLAVGKYWVNNHTHVLNAKKPYSNFLLYIILKKIAISHIVTGAVQPKINQENLKSLEIDVPSDDKIKLTVTETNNIWEKIQQNNKHILLLEKLRDTLLPKLMSGEVRVEI